VLNDTDDPAQRQVQVLRFNSDFHGHLPLFSASQPIHRPRVKQAFSRFMAPPFCNIKRVNFNLCFCWGS
jgi:hypothetical protein